MASLFLGSPLILLFLLRRFSLVLLLVCSLFAAAALPWMSGWAQRAPPLYPLPRSGSGQRAHVPFADRSFKKP